MQRKAAFFHQDALNTKNKALSHPKAEAKAKVWKPRPPPLPLQKGSPNHKTMLYTHSPPPSGSTSNYSSCGRSKMLQEKQAQSLGHHLVPWTPEKGDHTSYSLCKSKLTNSSSNRMMERSSTFDGLLPEITHAVPNRLILNNICSFHNWMTLHIRYLNSRLTEMN